MYVHIFVMLLNSPITLMIPSCMATVPCLLVALQEYVPESFLATFVMTRVPLWKSWWRRSRGRRLLPTKKNGKKP